MVELKSRQNFLPTCGGMAIFATLFERSFVRIHVASRAGTKLHVAIASRSPKPVRLVTFLACHFCVQAGQGVSRFRMIELGGLLPVIHVMTPLAVVSKLPLVWIGVAGQAIRRHPKKRFTRILVFDERPLARNHLRRRVTFLARQPRVLSFQVVSRQPVVKLFLRWLPMQKTEIFAVVLEVATHTILAIGVRHLNLGVIAVFCRKTLCHFLVTIETFIGRCAGAKLVAARALRSSR